MKCCKVGDLKKCLAKLPDNMDIKIDWARSSDWLRITEVRAEQELFNQDNDTSEYLELVVEAAEPDEEEEPEQQDEEALEKVLSDGKKIDLDK